MHIFSKQRTVSQVPLVAMLGRHPAPGGAECRDMMTPIVTRWRSFSLCCSRLIDHGMLCLDARGSIKRSCFAYVMLARTPVGLQR